eukprot:738194-Lingulodinium_polyedra.AAC.1
MEVEFDDCSAAVPDSGEVGGGDKPARPQPKVAPGRHKSSAAGVKGSRWCKGCHLSKKFESFAVNQAFCHDCKNKLDIIAKQARNQGKSEWFSQAKDDPTDCKRMLD